MPLYSLLVAALGDIISAFPKPYGRATRLFAFSLLVGLVAGLAAAAMEWGLHNAPRFLVGRFMHLGEPDYLTFQTQILFLPALGGLLSGLLVHWLCPKAGGHGTDAFIRAFHHNLGDLPLTGPLVRGVAAVGVISSGGSAGPEGPMASLGAALGSTLGRIFHLAPRERRILLVAGCAAGVGAIFRCPLGGALFAASVLYREPEFEASAIVPSFVASVIGYSTFMTLWDGLGSYAFMLTGADRLAFNSMTELIPYALLGPLCAAAAILFTTSLRFVERFVNAHDGLPRWFTPCIGGLATGALACLLPQVMDGRYRFIQNALDGFPGVTHSPVWWMLLFAAVIVAKCIATALTVGSGGSGGAFGPSVFIGGVVGALLGASLQAVAPDLFPADSSLRAALIPVGIGGVIAAVMRTPLAAIVMVIEMTGSYGLVVPLMLVCVSSFVLGRKFGLNTQQLPSAAQSPAHAGDALIHHLESWRAAQLMEPKWSQVVQPFTSLREMIARITPGTRPVFAVADGDKLLGLISVTDIQRIMQTPELADVIIAGDVMTSRLNTLSADDNAYDALELMSRHNHDVIPIVSADSQARWVGMLTRERIFEALRKSNEEIHRALISEHVGLAVIDREAQLQHLVMGVAPLHKDTIQRLKVPHDVVGQSIRQADFRNKHGAQIIAVELPNGTLQCPPDPDAPLKSDHRLIAIVGSADAPEGLLSKTPEFP
jgi:CIC family chloride channel protein